MLFFRVQKMRKIILLIGSVLFFSLLILFLITILPLLQPKNGQLSVNVSGQKARVYFDGQLAGTTPYYAKNLRVGDHKVIVEPEQKTAANFSWETNVTLSSSTLSLLNLDLAPSKTFSSGENLYFTPGQTGISVITHPDGAKIAVDGVEKGSSPLNLALAPGVHAVIIKKDGYLTRKTDVNIENGYKLSSIIYLAVDPFGKLKKLDSNAHASFFSITPAKNDLALDEWVAGINYLESTFTLDQTKFDVLLDSTGTSHVLNETEWANKISSKAIVNIGYLSRSEGETLSPKPLSAWQKIKDQFK